MGLSVFICDNTAVCLYETEQYQSPPWPVVTSHELSLHHELRPQQQLQAWLHTSPSPTAGNGRPLAPCAHPPLLAQPDQRSSSRREPPSCPCSSPGSQQALNEKPGRPSACMPRTEQTGPGSLPSAPAGGLEQERAWRWGQWPQAGHGDHKRAPSAGAGARVQERSRRCSTSG